MKKIVIQYTIVVGHKVNDYLEKGWQPWGSPFSECLVNDMGDMDYAKMQAMVRYKEETQPPERPVANPPHQIGKL